MVYIGRTIYHEALPCKTLGALHQLCKQARICRNSAAKQQCCVCISQLRIQCNHKNAMQLWHYTLLRNCNSPRVCQVSRISTDEVKRLSGESTVFSDKSVELQDLLLDLPTSLLEQKPSLSLLFTKSSSRSKEGRGDQQMSPELLNRAFSKKSTQYIS